MGLDMYLWRDVYIGASWHSEYRIQVDIKDTSNTNPKTFSIHPQKINSIREEFGYWRKANQIHKWFVDNVQDGQDDCKPYYVSKDKLKELLDTCNKVITYRDKPLSKEVEQALDSLLPTQSGFFFGGLEYDEWYFDQIQDTIDILNQVDFSEDEYPVSYYYEASW